MIKRPSALKWLLPGWKAGLEIQRTLASRVYEGAEGVGECEQPSCRVEACPNPTVTLFLTRGKALEGSA